MMFSGLAGKLIGFAVLVAVVGGIILVQHLRINSLRVENAELQVATVTLGKANEDQAALIERLTQDQAAFARRAADAEKARAKTEATAAARVKAALKRLNDAATESDRQPVSPVLRDALGAIQ